MKRKTQISVIGLGKLGSEIASVLDKYYHVIGIEKDWPVDEHGRADYSNLGKISFIIVPTPSLSNYKFTSEYVEEVLERIGIKQTVVIVSTLMPGETDRLQKLYPHLNLIYNPSFVALGTVMYDFTHPDFILIGSNKNVELLKKIYRKICKVTPRFSIMPPLEAEIAKLTLNCYITTKITFANQIGNLCYRLGIKPDAILNAIGQDRRIGNEYFKAGLGYGGPCFPRDNLAMSAYMLEQGIDPILTRDVHLLNENQPQEIISRLEKMMNLSTNKTSIGFPGLSYKKESDCEEKSQLKIIYDTLKSRGYNVKIGKGDLNLSWNGIK